MTLSSLDFFTLIVVIVVIIYSAYSKHRDMKEKKRDEEKKKQDAEFYLSKSFVCDYGKCDACKRTLVRERACHITEECFCDSIDYDEYCERRGGHMSADYIVLQCAGGLKGYTNKKYTICLNCISMFKKSGIIK